MNCLPFFGIVLSGLLIAHPGLAQLSGAQLSLQAEPLSVPASPWQVQRVLDLRADRSRLGPVRQGITNDAASANFSQPLAAELLQFITARLPPSVGARPVLMRVFTLAISEELRTNAERGDAELVADFLELQPDSTFRMLLAVGETTQRSGLDVTKHHATNVALLLQQALRQLAALPPTTTGTETLSAAAARAGQGGAMSQRFAIQTDPTPKRGFYRTFQEFRDNAPSEPDYAFAIEHIPHPGKRWQGIDEVQAAYLRTDARHPRTLVSRSKVWGLSDGKEMLIAYRGSFYPLRPGADGRSYTFLGPPVLDEQTANNMAAAAVLGGVLGAAIAGAASAGPPLLPYEVHLASGRVMPQLTASPTNATGQPVPDTARVYVYRRAVSPQKQVIGLVLPGQLPRDFAARQWTTLQWTDRRQELKICAQVADGAEACHQFVPDFSQFNYVECVVPADGGPPSFRPVSAKEGAFEIRRLRMLAKSQQ